MNWYKYQGKVLKVDGKVAINEDCCLCLTTCSCDPCTPLIACISSNSCRLDQQRVSLNQGTPSSGYCRAYLGQITLDCCEAILELELQWKNGAVDPNDVELRWRYGSGGAYNLSLPSIPPSTCDPFVLQYTINLDASSCCDDPVVITILCNPDDCYCPQFLNSISGVFVDNIGSCLIANAPVDFILGCPETGECRRLISNCNSIPGCAYEIDLALVWAENGTDHNDVTLYWKTYDLSNPGVVQTTGSAGTSDPPSTCDPLCFVFKGITLPSACCGHTVELHIGNCIQPCCCPKLGIDPIPSLDVDITGGVVGNTTIPGDSGQQGFCGVWEAAVSVTGQGGDCGENTLDIRIECSEGSTDPYDLILDVGVSNPDCIGQFDLVPDSATCGPPMVVTWIFNIGGGKDCDCSDITLTATITGETFIASASTGQPSSSPLLSLPPSVDEWLT